MSVNQGPSDYLDLGNWNATCSMCGHKKKASQLVKNWQGQWRCPIHNEPRQPQDFVRATPDIITPPWVQKTSEVWQGPTLFVVSTNSNYGPFTINVCQNIPATVPVYITLDTPQGFLGPYLAAFNLALCVPIQVVLTPAGTLVIYQQPTITGTPAYPLDSDGSTTFSITATSPQPSQVIRVTGTPSGSVITPSSATTDNNGNASFSVTSLGARTYTYTSQLLATNAPSTNTAIATFGIRPSACTVATSPSSVTLGGTSSAIITLLDGLGNPVSGHVVTIAITGGTIGGVTSAPSSVTTNALGVATFTLTSVSGTGNIGTYTITATDTTQGAAGEVLPSTATIAINAPAFSWFTKVVTLPSTGNWIAAAYDGGSANGAWCITSYNSNKACYSTDGGESWTASTLPSTKAWGQVVSDYSGHFMVGEENSTGIAYGGPVSWTAATAPASFYACKARNGTTILALGVFGTAYSSSSGASWTAGTTFTNTNSNTPATMAGINTPSTVTVFSVANPTPSFRANTDNLGSAWTNVSEPFAGNTMFGATGTGGGSSPRFLAVTSSGTAYAWSDDGTTWAALSLPVSNTWASPIYLGNCWIIPAKNSTVCLVTTTPKTQSSWIQKVLPTTWTVNSIAWGADPNGQQYRTVLPVYNSNTAILITTDGTT